MTRVLLTRTGNSQLGFDGERLSNSEGRLRHGREHNRWHNVSIYRTKGGSYVVAIEYRTTLDHEEHRSAAEECKNASEVVKVLRSYDPEEAVALPGASEPGFDAESAKTLRDLRRRFEAQVGEVLADHPEFEEQID